MTETQRSLLIAPGQGSQRPNMYKMVEVIPELGETYELADEISIQVFGPQQIKGRSLSEIARDATQEELAADTVITQPLIVATSIGLIKHLKLREAYSTVYGHSLGELSALFAAGCLTERDAIELAMLRGIYSKEASGQKPSGMAAIMNLPHDVAEKLHFGEEEGVVVSTVNSPDQFTISGYKDKVDSMVADIRNRFQRAKGLSREEKRQLPNAVKLAIGEGFHSFIMRPAQKRHREALNRTPMAVPATNFFSNYSHDYEGHPDTIRQHLENQLVHPVHFWRDIGILIMDGHVRVVETGPGSPLTVGLREQQEKGTLPPDIELIAAETDLLGIAA